MRWTKCHGRYTMDVMRCAYLCICKCYFKSVNRKNCKTVYATLSLIAFLIMWVNVIQLCLHHKYYLACSKCWHFCVRTITILQFQNINEYCSNSFSLLVFRTRVTILIHSGCYSHFIYPVPFHMLHDKPLHISMRYIYIHFQGKSRPAYKIFHFSSDHSSSIQFYSQFSTYTHTMHVFIYLFIHVYVYVLAAIDLCVCVLVCANVHCSFSSTTIMLV